MSEAEETERLRLAGERPVPLSREEAERLTARELRAFRAQEAAADTHRRPDDLADELRTLPQEQAATFHSRLQSFVSAVYDNPDDRDEEQGEGEEVTGGGAGVAELQSSPKYRGLGALATSDPIRFERLNLAQRLMDPDDGVAPYCVFCVHGTAMLEADNTQLLSQFVGRDGTLFPRRMTNVCAKHQRKLAKTVKKSRWMGLIPLKAKLHPALRSPGMKTEDFGRGDDQGAGASHGGAGVGAFGDVGLDVGGSGRHA